MSEMHLARRTELAIDLLADMILEFLAKEPNPPNQPTVLFQYMNPIFQYKQWPFQYTNVGVKRA